jgi:hypothetical protein
MFGVTEFEYHEKILAHGCFPISRIPSAIGKKLASERRKMSESASSGCLSASLQLGYAELPLNSEIGRGQCLKHSC